MTVEFNDAYEDVLFHVPEARQALIDGVRWEYKPESAEYADDFPWYCDDCDTFHHSWVVFGYEVEDYGDGMKLYRNVWTVDSDGDWDVSSTAEVGSEEEAQQSVDFSLEESAKAWRNYYQFVRDRGIEPLGECFGGHRQLVDWEFFAAIKPEGLVLVSARSMEGGDIATFFLPEELPAHAKDFFFGDGKCPLICGPEDVETICSKDGGAVRRLVDKVLYGQDQIFTPESDEVYRARVVEWATKNLVRVDWTEVTA